LKRHSGREDDGIDIVYKAHDLYIKDHPEHSHPVTCTIPLKGIYRVGGNSRRDAITHAGMNRYCYDFLGCDETGRLTYKEISGPGNNKDYIGFGNPLYAPVDGVVESFEDNKEDLKPASFYRLIDGNFISIKGDDNLHYLLVHNKKNSITVKAGDRVKKGDIVAQLGNSGMTTVPHLHFGVYSEDWLVSLPVQFETYTVIQSDKQGMKKKNSIPQNNEIIEVQD
jgi:murein DD-endopeptidase MepM/ murein hydrolase activator NlpD